MNTELLYKEVQIHQPGSSLDSLTGIIVEYNRTPGRNYVTVEVSNGKRAVFKPSQLSITLGTDDELTILTPSPKPTLPERPTLGEMVFKKFLGLPPDAPVVKVERE